LHEQSRVLARLPDIPYLSSYIALTILAIATLILRQTQSIRDILTLVSYCSHIVLQLYFIWACLDVHPPHPSSPSSNSELLLVPSPRYIHPTVRSFICIDTLQSNDSPAPVQSLPKTLQQYQRHNPWRWRPPWRSPSPNQLTFYKLSPIHPPHALCRLPPLKEWYSHLENSLDTTHPNQLQVLYIHTPLTTPPHTQNSHIPPMPPNTYLTNPYIMLIHCKPKPQPT
jgi:hypothetical protein